MRLFYGFLVGVGSKSRFISCVFNIVRTFVLGRMVVGSINNGSKVGAGEGCFFGGLWFKLFFY